MHVDSSMKENSVWEDASNGPRMRDLQTLIAERTDQITRELNQQQVTLPDRILLEAAQVWIAIGRALPEFGELDDPDLAFEILFTFLDDPDAPERVDNADLHMAMAAILTVLHPSRSFNTWKKHIDATP